VRTMAGRVVTTRPIPSFGPACAGRPALVLLSCAGRPAYYDLFLALRTLSERSRRLGLPATRASPINVSRWTRPSQTRCGGESRLVMGEMRGMEERV